MADKRDPLRGLNPNQSGPLDKIQNGDPRSSPNRDQRSMTAESGGSLGSLQTGPTGTKEGQVPPHDNLEKTARGPGVLVSAPAGVDTSGIEASDAHNRAGVSPALSGDKTLKEVTDTADGATKTTLTEAVGGKEAAEAGADNGVKIDKDASKDNSDAAKSTDASKPNELGAPNAGGSPQGGHQSEAASSSNPTSSGTDKGTGLPKEAVKQS